MKRLIELEKSVILVFGTQLEGAFLFNAPHIILGSKRAESKVQPSVRAQVVCPL